MSELNETFTITTEDHEDVVEDMNADVKTVVINITENVQTSAQ